MSLKLNHFVCPHCGHDFYAEGAYATCDGCQCTFYVAQSQTCTPNMHGLTLKTNVIITTAPTTTMDAIGVDLFTAMGDTR